MRTHVTTLAAAVAAQLILLVPVAGAQQPARSPQPPSERRAPERRPPRADSVERRQTRVMRWTDSVPGCSCTLGDARGRVGALGELRALRELGATRRLETLRKFLHADSLGEPGRLRILPGWQGAPGAPGAMERVFEFAGPRRDRAAVGLLLGDASSRGLEVVEVTPGGPADRAGIRAGDRLTAVDGTSLRVAPADSGDPVLVGAVARRLTRRLDTLAAGDTVVLAVAGRDGGERTVRVATVRADELASTGGGAVSLGRTFGVMRGGTSIGLTARPTGTPRDTLGVFVAAVAPGGRADRAGIHEGMRIVAVNGTDLRVDPADAGDRAVAAARAAQLERAIADARDGGALTIRVRDGMQLRDVKVP